MGPFGDGMPFSLPFQMLLMLRSLFFLFHHILKVILTQTNSLIRKPAYFILLSASSYAKGHIFFFKVNVVVFLYVWGLVLISISDIQILRCSSLFYCLHVTFTYPPEYPGQLYVAANTYHNANSRDIIVTYCIVFMQQ